MVQVSYPGVYIQEVPSGSRTITGVATSVTAFVGMTKRGPMDTPTTVLGFTDYTRIFGDDTSQGEMTDQVRQFFLNGGTTAIIMRIADGDSQSSVAIPSVATPVITLTSRGSGADENLLRATFDYNTAQPEKTFNVTVFRELFDASGNASVGESETLNNLSLNSFDPRFAQDIFQRDSVLATALVNATNSTPPVGVSSASYSGRIVANILTELDNAILAGRNQLRVTLSDSTKTVTKTVILSSPGGAAAPPIAVGDIKTQIEGVFTGEFSTAPVVTATVLTVGTAQMLRIAVAAHDIQITSSATADVATEFGLGTDNGGLEVSRGANLRPRPNGLVSLLHADEAVGATDRDLARLRNFAILNKSIFTSTAITLSGSVTLVPPAGVTFPPGPTLAEGSKAGFWLSNVRENLEAIAAAINRFSTDWSAEVQGFRLVITALFGTSTNVAGNTFATPADLIDDTPINILYASGTAPTSIGVAAGARAFQFVGGLDGDPPIETDYTDAYDVIDSKVDLFNLLILPKSKNDPDRSALWGPASSFCLRRRAFLLIDAADTVVNIDQAVQAVKDLRIGIVKDHSALYWPRIEVNPDGARRAIDASGSVAGVMSRIDSNRGVWKAPAGLEADVRGALAVTTPMSDPENGRLNPQALNAIRIFPNGIIVWGSRTMDGFDNSGNDDFKYVPVRRFTLFIEESLYRGLKFAVFEPNAEPLWSAIRTAVGAFMNNLFRQGAFAGQTTREAYFVKVDSETTTQNDINLGIVNVVVGFAPLKPAEFVVVTIKQQAGQVQV